MDPYVYDDIDFQPRSSLGCLLGPGTWCFRGGLTLRFQNPLLAKSLQQMISKVGGGMSSTGQCLRVMKQTCLEAIGDFRSLDC